jgi:hypothetical protein
MTLGQSLLGTLFLVSMELAWWEAAVLFALGLIQFLLSPVPQNASFWGTLATHIHRYVTWAYWAFAAVETARLLIGWRKPLAFALSARMWRAHVRR